MYSRKTAFQKNLSTMNSQSLRIALLLIILNINIFWILDWYTLPKHIYFTAILRTIVTIVSATVLWLTYRKKTFVHKHNYALTSFTCFVAIGAVSMMCWIESSMNAQYYPGICLVFVFMGISFTWNSSQSIFFGIISYCIYLASGLLFVQEPPPIDVILTNNFFMIAFMVVAYVGQQNRYKIEQKRFNQKINNRNTLAKIRHLASVDHLTQIYNRSYMHDVGNRELERCVRHNRNFAILLLDVDFFKKINDTHGHKAGDIVLQYLAKAIKENVRNVDIVCRYGGEEFIVIMPDISLENTLKLVATRIQNFLKNNAIEINSELKLNITVSIGVSHLECKKESLDELVARADRHLYFAKENGRDQIAYKISA